MTLVALVSISLLLFSFSIKTTTLTQAYCLPDQHHALIQLKQGFKTNELFSWNASTNCCIWDGITCDEQTGMVTTLNIFNRSISGEINPALFNLTSLWDLNLSFNYFYNTPLPQIGFERLANLTHLNLSFSGFAGQVPVGFSSLTNLISLDLSYNDFYLNEIGLINLLGNLTNLQVLRLDSINISTNGSEWGKAVFQIGPTLQELSMSECGLRGNFQDEILHLTNLKVLDLSHNYFYNITLPQTGFEQLGNLTHLDLSYSGFVGQVPIGIFALRNLISLDLTNYLYLHDTGLKTLLSNLTKLQVLRLDEVDLSLDGSEWGKAVFQVGSTIQELSMMDCGIRGNFPDEIFHLTNLKKLDLSENSMLSGQLPKFRKQSFLHSLLLSNSNFAGPLPYSIGNLQYLSVLDLSMCNFYGEIPPSITNLTRLRVFDLGSNRLTGTIPMSLFSHLSLDNLDLSYNQLSGYLPEFSNGSSVLSFIYLENNNLQGHVPISIFKSLELLDLYLSSNNFNGTLNLDVIQNNQMLGTLDLSNNKLSILEGKNHNESFYASFPQLEYLGLASCNLIDYPTFLSYQNYIYIIDLSNNILTGEIPLSISNVTSLLVLDLSYNNLTGTIPPWLLEHAKLEVLNLKSNQLSGPLQQNISKPCGLHAIDLNGNLINGSLPKFLMYCNALEILDLGNNQIVNKFPYWLGNLEKLEVLVLRSNMFHGKISDVEIKTKGNDSFFSMLKVLDLSSNHFSDTLPNFLFVNLNAMMVASSTSSLYYWERINGSIIPNEYSFPYKDLSFDLKDSLGIFSFIDTSNNAFWGRIPEEIGKLKSLDVLNLSHNALIGPIPQKIANLQQLQLLDLSSNQLSGHIPQELTSLTFLSALNLSYNNFIGEIPEARQFSTFSNASYIGNPGLCGAPLSLQCPAPPSNHVFNKGFPLKSSTNIIGLSVSIGLGLGVGFASVIWAMISWENGKKWFNFIIDRFYFRHFH